jgi:hypothetical protein
MINLREKSATYRLDRRLGRSRIGLDIVEIRVALNCRESNSSRSATTE